MQCVPFPDHLPPNQSQPSQHNHATAIRLFWAGSANFCLTEQENCTHSKEYWPTEGPLWGHSRCGLGAVGAVLEPFCGHLSPKIDKVYWKLTFEVPTQRALGGTSADNLTTPLTGRAGRVPDRGPDWRCCLERTQREIGNLLPNNRRQRRTCYALCHILYPLSAAQTCIFRMDSNSTSFRKELTKDSRVRWFRLRSWFMRLQAKSFYKDCRVQSVESLEGGLAPR